MKKDIVSIVIATFNNEKTLPLTLTSIRSQTYPQEAIEILVVDGGSTDKTHAIAKKFGSKIIPNPLVDPVNAKLLGYAKARGKYILYIDADEEIIQRTSIEKKFSIFTNKKVKAVIGSGYNNPPHSSFITHYINEFGDPFSFFIYKISKNAAFFVQQIITRYPLVKNDNDYVIVDFEKADQIPIMELGAANSMVDLEYTRKVFPDFDKEIFAHWTNLLIEKNMYIAITKNDGIIHYASTSMNNYKNKLKWRIKNNIFYSNEMGKAGYIGRERFSSSAKYKKYLYIPYVYTFLFLLIDAFLLVVSRRDIRYFMHIPLSIYTANQILYYYLLKLFGGVPQRKNYDGSKNITG